MRDKYIAEKLGLCWHRALTEKELSKLPILGGVCPKCKKCGASKLVWERNNPKFSQSVPLLKAEAKRAGLWNEFIEWNHQEILISLHLEPNEIGSEMIFETGVHAHAEILTDPALCAQAFEAFLKEREGE